MNKGVSSHSSFKGCVAALLGIGIGLLAASQAALAADLEMLKPGVLQVTIQPYMPYTALKDEKLVGLDSDILAAVADKLGLKMEVSVTDFPACWPRSSRGAPTSQSAG